MSEIDESGRQQKTSDAVQRRAKELEASKGHEARRLMPKSIQQQTVAATITSHAVVTTRYSDNTLEVLREAGLGIERGIELGNWRMIKEAKRKILSLIQQMEGR